MRSQYDPPQAKQTNRNADAVLFYLCLDGIVLMSRCFCKTNACSGEIRNL